MHQNWADFLFIITFSSHWKMSNFFSDTQRRDNIICLRRFQASSNTLQVSNASIFFLLFVHKTPLKFQSQLAHVPQWNLDKSLSFTRIKCPAFIDGGNWEPFIFSAFCKAAASYTCISELFARFVFDWSLHFHFRPVPTWEFPLHIQTCFLSEQSQQHILQITISHLNTDWDKRCRLFKTSKLRGPLPLIWWFQRPQIKKFCCCWNFSHAPCNTQGQKIWIKKPHKEYLTFSQKF